MDRLHPVPTAVCVPKQPTGAYGYGELARGNLLHTRARELQS
jgi:hypothetical protein